jgi:hypothetical protein
VCTSDAAADTAAAAEEPKMPAVLDLSSSLDSGAFSVDTAECGLGQTPSV